MTTTLFVDIGEQEVDAKNIIKKPSDAIKSLIAQQSAGNINRELLHILITTIMNTNDNKLKRLLYYYFETILHEDTFIMCINQINKDLVGPNEYVRGFALKLVSKIENSDHVSINLIRENLKHKNYYVRQNAVFCLTEIALRFEMDIDKELIRLLYKETNPIVIKMIFICLDRLSINYEEFQTLEYPEEVLDVLVSNSSDIQFLKKCQESEFKSVVFKASCKLLEQGESINIDQLISIMADNSALKTDFIDVIPYLQGNGIIDFFSLLEPFNLEFSSKIIDQCFKNVETQDFYKIVDMLFTSFSEVKDSSETRKYYKIMLLEKLASFASTHCVYKNEVIDSCLNNITSDDPDTVYAGLKFLYAIESNKLESQTIIVDKLMDSFSKIKYGKILRFSFDVISLNINKSQYERLLDILFSNFNEKCVYYLSEEPEIFLGTHICLSLARIHRPEWKLKGRVIALMLQFIEHGKMNGTIDCSSKSTITTAIRAILNDSNTIIPKIITNTSLKPANVLEPLTFDILNPVDLKKIFYYDNSSDKKESTVQLTGLGEPLYVECNLSYTKYEILLDILIINQTDSYLQDIGLYFSHSKQLKATKTKYPTSMQPNSAMTLKSKFEILESSNCFITGSILFRYPSSGGYGSKPYRLALSEIKLDINEFLEGTTADFSEEWKKMEWESVYSLSSSFSSMESVLGKIINLTNGKVCNKENAYSFLVANIACFTIKKALVLINICQSENKNIEIRVRSVDEFIVKSVRDLISECIKTIQ